MSANNWRVCPQCKQKKVSEAKALLAAALATYGMVPPDEFVTALGTAQERLQSATQFGGPDNEAEFREDYNIGTYEMEDGSAEFHISYHGECQACGFTKSFEHKEQVLARLALTPGTPDAQEGT